QRVAESVQQCGIIGARRQQSPQRLHRFTYLPLLLEDDGPLVFERRMLRMRAQAPIQQLEGATGIAVIAEKLRLRNDEVDGLLRMLPPVLLEQSERGAPVMAGQEQSRRLLPRLQRKRGVRELTVAGKSRRHIPLPGGDVREVHEGALIRLAILGKIGKALLRLLKIAGVVRQHREAPVDVGAWRVA